MISRALSRSVEDYLKAIYGLSGSGDSVSTSAIAEALDIQPASVTGMVKRMAGWGLLEHLPYKGVVLTKPGTREALRVLRRHRILETYLCERLGFSWDDVHDEAERLEHAASEQLIEQMATALGSPSHDPHGSPIPTPCGDIENTVLSTLADAGLGTRVVIRSVGDEDGQALRAMAEEGLVPGAHVTIATGRVVTDSVAFAVEGDTPLKGSVSREVARHVYVLPDPR